MDKPSETTIDGKRVVVYQSEAANAPIVYSIMHAEAGRAILEACEGLGCRPFHLVSLSGLRWDEELSPWPHGPVVSRDDHFTGEADRFARCLTEQIIPPVEEAIGKPSSRVIAGYSMGGLFALYTPYRTDAFSGAVSASGSVWYPGFVPYVEAHDYPKRPDAIYLSLGDLESRTRHAVLSQTELCMEKLCAVYRERSIRSVFELNPGNHFRDPAYRMAKGIAWMLA